MSELAIRTVSGIVMIAVALAAAIVGGYAFAILAAAVATAVYYEWTKLTKTWGFGWAIGGFLYAGCSALALLWIRERADNGDGLWLVLWVFIVVWSVDIGAYFTGRAIGGPKLAPSISPGKTWAGFYGGVAAATLLGGAWVLYTRLSLVLILLAPLFGAAAQGGDLFESWIKRRAGVKDSGHLLPGHGGVFDRVDGLLPVAILTAIAAMAGAA
jgi:phosphatidate cytidylyltransferase